uniref:NADH dehydrogenase subunit 4 n=1 Tax=Busonia albilateralis TaxID=2479888 RepID=UPI0024115682|nr:NADH dehydrogenase subunit 4 [Busonia albilateralis]WEP24818.1 NADH dehydrogenase subunit 4 [Busonia albilateralis]
MHMMKILFFMFFLIPTMENWFVLNFYLMFCCFLFCLLNLNSFFCNISYFFGLDYYSYSIIIMMFILVSLMLLSSYNLSDNFYLLLWLICLSLFMIFSVLNILIMYFFFELSLIPLVLLIMNWGYQPERLFSVLYLFFYTLFASLPLLIMIMYLYMMNNCLFFDLMKLDSNFFVQNFFLVFAFLVKLPMFMFHFWLPKAHVQAPVSGSMILAGLFLKIGGYGLIRVMLINELTFLKYSYLWYSMSILGSLLVSLICFIQFDLKSMIAYSSICHMGLCLMGILSMQYYGVMGSYFMMISHGFCSSGLFFLSYTMYIRIFSRSFFLNKGLLIFLPSMSLFWFLLCCLNMSCPPSLNFISEVFIMMSMMSYFNSSYFYVIFISFFSACFNLYMFMYSNHGLFHNIYSFSIFKVCEFLILIVHIIPLFFIVLMMDLLLF